MTDCDRILAVARLRPVNTTDFIPPNVCDGEKPILRVPARILDLHQKRGHIFTKRTEKNRTATYTLAYDAEQGDGNTAGEPIEASPTVAALGAPHAAAADGSPLLPAVGGHQSFGDSPGHVQAGQSLPLPPSGLGGSPERSLGVTDDASAGDGLPPVAGSLFDAEEFSRRDHWREAA